MTAHEPIEPAPDAAEITVAAICDRIGRKVVADRLGVGKTAVSNAVAENQCPARWYIELQVLCREHGMECPVHLFNFYRLSAEGPQAAPADDLGENAA